MSILTIFVGAWLWLPRYWLLDKGARRMLLRCWCEGWHQCFLGFWVGFLQFCLCFNFFPWMAVFGMFAFIRFSTLCLGCWWNSIACWVFIPVFFPWHCIIGLLTIRFYVFSFSFDTVWPGIVTGNCEAKASVLKCASCSLIVNITHFLINDSLEARHQTHSLMSTQSLSHAHPNTLLVSLSCPHALLSKRSRAPTLSNARTPPHGHINTLSRKPTLGSTHARTHVFSQCLVQTHFLNC